jgi:Domain of unknown function (DUF6398)
VSRICPKQWCSQLQTVSYGCGALRTWAAGAIDAVGSNNFLFDPSQVPHLRADRLSELLVVPKSTIAAKAKRIRDALGLDAGADVEFSTLAFAGDAGASRVSGRRLGYEWAVCQPTSQIAPSRSSTGNRLSEMAPAVALMTPASGLYAPWGPRTILPVSTS